MTFTSSVDTLRWRDGRFELLDQRCLPLTVRYLAYDSAEGVAGAIRDMVVRGAPAIGCAAAWGVALEAQRAATLTTTEFDAAMRAGLAVLAASRPTAVNLFWALSRMEQRLRELAAEPVSRQATLLLEEAAAITREDVEVNRRMGAHGAALIPDGARILTHCNAGALATAGHGTALGVVRSAIAMGKKVQLFADETRPFLQGARLTSWELMQDGIPVTLIADNAAGYLMSRGEIDLAIVGADRVAANGDVANKIGTYQVAVLARRHRIPFYVAAPVSTIDAATPDGAAIAIEERDGAEVTGYGGLCWAPVGVSVRNPVFDVTPAELVTALITERGVVRNPERETIRELLHRT